MVIWAFLVPEIDNFSPFCKSKTIGYQLAKQYRTQLNLYQIALNSGKSCVTMSDAIIQRNGVVAKASFDDWQSCVKQ